MNRERVQWRGGRGRAFTLIELLVVMAVVGVLASLLLPALARARGHGRAALCLGNLRQWGIATQLYASDHEDFLPPDGMPNPGPKATNVGWYVQLPQTLGIAPYHEMSWRTNADIEPGPSLWICPANRRRSNGKNLFHYCLNEHVNGTGAEGATVRLSHVPGVSTVVWLFDSKNLPAVGYWGYVHTNLHGGGAQFLFLDGHATRFRNAEYWDYERDKGRTNASGLVWIPERR